MQNLTFYGSTVDAIAPQEQNVLSQYRQHNWQAEALNAASAQRANELSALAWQRQQEAADRQAQIDESNRIGLLQFGSQLAEKRAGEAERKHEFDVSEKFQREFLGPRYAAETEKLKNYDPQKERNFEQMNKYAAEAANIGVFDPAQFPKLPPELLALHQARNTTTRAEIDAQDAAVKNAANLLNTYQRLKAEVTAVPTSNPDALAERNQRIAALEPHVKLLTSPRNPISQLLEYHDRTDQWMPLLPSRSWHISPTTATVTPTPAPVISNPLASFSTSTATTPPPMPAPAKFNARVGKFIVTED